MEKKHQIHCQVGIDHFAECICDKELKPLSQHEMEKANLISDNEEALAFRITAVYGNLMQLSHQNNQVVGEKNDYYVTLEQLENALMAMPKSF